MIEKKLLKFEAEGQEFAKFLRSLEQFIKTVKGQNNNRIIFLNSKIESQEFANFLRSLIQSIHTVKGQINFW